MGHALCYLINFLTMREKCINLLLNIPKLLDNSFAIQIIILTFAPTNIANDIIAVRYG